VRDNMACSLSLVVSNKVCYAGKFLHCLLTQHLLVLISFGKSQHIAYSACLSLFCNYVSPNIALVTAEWCVCTIIMVAFTLAGLLVTKKCGRQ
jgi:hypothetical protein